jgi:hypothetical protein
VWIAQIRSVSIAIVLIGLIGGVVLFFWGNNPTSNNTPTPTPTATILPTPTNTPTPTMTPPPLVTIEQMLLSTSREYYRLEATLENPLQQSVLIRFLTVTIIKSDNDSWGCSGEDTIYKVSDNIEVGNTDEKGSTPFWGTVTEGNFSSFSYQVEGEFVQGCAGAVLIFGFDTSIELPAGKNMTIYLLLPRTWQVTGLEESFLRDKDEPISQQINYELEVPKDGYDLLRIELEVDTKTGTITGSKEFERF